MPDVLAGGNRGAFGQAAGRRSGEFLATQPDDLDIGETALVEMLAQQSFREIGGQAVDQPEIEFGHCLGGQHRF